MMCKLGKYQIAIFVLMCMASFGVILIYSWVSSFPSYKVWNSHVCACKICLTGRDPWFRARINSSPQLFLSKDHNIEVDDFKWWTGLQEGRRSFNLYNRTLHKLFQIFLPIPAVVRTSPNRCGSCAVVGNSVNLKGSRYGPLIDFHDIVIRMNQGHTRGFEADVGSKTTHRVMYPESAIKLDNTSRLVFVAFKIKDLLWLQNQFNPNAKTTKRIANKNLVMVLNPAFIRYVHEAWLGTKGRYPSTGFLTIALSMQMCDEVHVFGFGADGDGNWIHYFEQLTSVHRGTGPHDGNNEYEVIQKLHQKRKIIFFAPQ